MQVSHPAYGDMLVGDGGGRIDDMTLRLTMDEFNQLILDPCGNHVKIMIAEGTIKNGNPPVVSGDIAPPRRSFITNAEIEYNARRFGYRLRGERSNGWRLVRPEYVVSAILLGHNIRRIESGIPVILCKAPIVWGLMAYEAIRYGYESTLLGLVREIMGTGRIQNANAAMRALELFGAKPLPHEGTMEAMRVYGC